MTGLVDIDFHLLALFNGSLPMPYSLLAEAGAPLDPPAIVVGLLGGLALFLYGMHKMSDGLKAAAGEKMKLLLAKLTTNRFAAAVTGAFVTAILQSSSITTVLVVGFVSAGLMNLAQTVGVIMGANVGTTVTAQILAFNITDYAWMMIAAGFAAWSFSKRDVMRNIGAMLMGLGMLFIGMGQMGEATSPLRTHQPFIDLMQSMDRRLLAMLVGAAFTALVQSSSATIGIVIMLATQGHISLEAGISLGIGAKIGTCVTALLAGIGKPPEARRVGVVHTLFNVLGALLWLPFIDQLAAMATAVSPSHPELEGVERLAEETPRQVANAITIFACINLSVMIWFTRPVARLAERLVPERPEKKPERVEPKYLDPVFLETPALALNQIRMELGTLGECVRGMLNAAPPALASRDLSALDRVEAMDDDVDHLHSEILVYAAQVARNELQTSESKRLEALIEMANNLEAIGDLIETNLIALGRQSVARNTMSSPALQDTAAPLYEEVLAGLDDILRATEEEDLELAREVEGRKKRVRSLSDAALERLAADLLAGDGDNVEQFRSESEAINQIHRLFYHVRRIAKALAHSVPGDVLTAASSQPRED